MEDLEDLVVRRLGGQPNPAQKGEPIWVSDITYVSTLEGRLGHFPLNTTNVYAEIDRRLASLPSKAPMPPLTR